MHISNDFFFRLFKMSINIPQKVGSLIHIVENMEDGNDITSEVKGVKYQIIGDTATLEKTDPAYLAYLVSNL